MQLRFRLLTWLGIALAPVGAAGWHDLTSGNEPRPSSAPGEAQIADALNAWVAEAGIRVETTGRGAYSVYVGRLGGWLTRIDYIAYLYRLSRISGDAGHLKSARAQVAPLYQNGDKALYQLTNDAEFRPPFRSNWDKLWGTERKHTAPTDGYPIPPWGREASYPTSIGTSKSQRAAVDAQTDRFRRRCLQFGGVFEAGEPREVYVGRVATGGRGYSVRYEDAYKLAASISCRE